MSALKEILVAQQGVLFVDKPAIVSRSTYCGRGIVAEGNDGRVKDERGYNAVERWIVSKTQALNAVVKEGEGISRFRVGDQVIRFDTLCQEHEQLLLGAYADRWPLTKILDIGGKPVHPSFTDAGHVEAPPIPCHVHAGEVKEGKVCPPGKIEAYFFPPLDIGPYQQPADTIVTRLGFKPSTTRTEALAAIDEGFGIDDRLYALLQEYQVQPWTSWTIQPRVVHAPGPYLTFEIQRPQDDFNMLSWQLGCPCNGIEERSELRSSVQLKGLDSVQSLFEQTVDWDLSCDAQFEAKWFHHVSELDASASVRRVRIFFDHFDGEGFVVRAGCTWTRTADERPFAGLVWAGQGSLNGHPVSQSAQSEFLVTPAHSFTLTADPQADLVVFVVFPMLDV